MKSDTSHRYRLAEHVHACHIANQVVILDLKLDKYLGIGSLDFDRLSDLIIDFQVQRSNNSTLESKTTPDADSDRADPTDLLTEMLEHGMLRPYSKIDVPSRSRSIERPRRALIDGYAEVPRRFGWRDVGNFLQASAVAATLLRWSSIERVVERVRRHRRECLGASLDVNRARRCVAVFNRLRPLVYTDGNECLFSSLTMHEYLRHYRLLPRLVFGVAVDPFRAHCWLQQADVVINDMPEYVREYTPILVI